jgi:hypothetical protein
MDGKSKWWALPLILLKLPGIIRDKLRPHPKAPNASRWNDLPVTEQEEEAWREMEKRQ